MNAQTKVVAGDCMGSINRFMEDNGIASISRRVAGRVLVVLDDGRAAAATEVSVALERARQPDAVRLS